MVLLRVDIELNVVDFDVVSWQLDVGGRRTVILLEWVLLAVNLVPLAQVFLAVKVLDK